MFSAIETDAHVYAATGLPGKGQLETKHVEFKLKLNVEPAASAEDRRIAKALELWKDYRDAEVVRDVVQFANTDGGTLLLGVAEEKHRASALVGLTNATDDRRWVLQKLKKFCPDTDLVSRVDTKIIQVNDGGGTTVDVLAINVPAFPELVHLRYRDGLMEAYRRTDYNRDPMTLDDIIRHLGNHNRVKRLAFERYIDPNGPTWVHHGAAGVLQPAKAAGRGVLPRFVPAAVDDEVLVLHGVCDIVHGNRQHTERLRPVHIPLQFLDAPWPDASGRMNFRFRGTIGLDQSAPDFAWTVGYKPPPP